MAAPELRLNVSFDLAYFKGTALPSLATAAAGFRLPIQVKFDRTSITKELRLLDRSLSGKKYNLEIGTVSLDSAIKKAKELQQIINQPKGQFARANALQGVLGKQSGKNIINAADVKNLYSAALDAGIKGLSGNINQSRGVLERELKTAFGGASDNALKGLINGLLSGKGDLKNASASLGETVEKSLKDSLEIHSPSKRTQRIGEQTADGFWLGLINNIVKGERSAATSIRSAVVNAFKQGLSGAGEISGSMVAFERQLAEGVRRALAGAIVQALRDGLKGSISPGIKGTMVGGAGGFATGGLTAGLGAAKAVGAAGLARLSQGGAGAGMQRAIGALGGDTSGIQSFLAQGQEQVMNAVVQGGVQGAIVGAVGVAAVAGATGFAGGAAKSLFKQGVEAFMGSMLRTAYVTVRDLTTGTYLLGSAAVTGLKTGDTQRAVGEVARALLSAGAETARNEGRALARQAGAGLIAGGKIATGGISGAFNAGQGGREQALQNAYDALIAVLIKGAVDLQGLPDGTTIRALKQAVLSLKAAMEIASVQVSVTGEASRPGVRNMLRSGERANGAQLSPIIGTVVEDLGNTKYLPRPGEGQSGRKIQEGLDNIANAAAEAARQALNNQARAIANTTRRVQVRDLGTTGQPLLSGGRTAGLLPQGASYGRTPAPYGQAYNPYAITKYTGGGWGGGTGSGPGNFAAAGGGGGNGPGNFIQQLSNIKLPGSGAIASIGNEFANAAKQVLLFGTAYKALAFAQSFPAQVMDAVTSLQSYRNSLKAITPSAKEFADSNNYILGLVDKYNIPLDAARSGFTKLYASMAPAGFSGNQIRDLFGGISKAAATFGMSSDKVDRVTYAFAQMASKGQVMSEELKGQLGDVLPGALGIFADAAGFKGKDAITKFGKALEDGAFKGDEMVQLLNNVTVKLNEEFGPGAEGAARTMQGVMNRMANSTKLFYETFEPLAINFANSVVVPITNGIKTLTDGFNAFFTNTEAKTSGGILLAQELTNLQPVFAGIGANLQQLIPLLTQFGQIAYQVVKATLQLASTPLVGFLLKVYAVILPLNIAVGILRGLWALNSLQLLIFNARVITGTSSLAAFRAMMAATGATSSAAAGSIRGAGMALRSFFAISVVGIILVGISALAEHFMTLKGAIDGVRDAARQTRAQISALANAGDVGGINNAKALLGKEANTFTNLRKYTSGKPMDRPEMTEAVAKKFEQMQMGGFIRRGPKGIPFVSDFVNADKIISERLSGINESISEANQKMELAKKIAANMKKDTGATTPIGMDISKPEKTKVQSLEGFNSLQDKLADEATKAQLERDKQLFENKKRLIDLEFAYRESGATETQKFALDIAKKLKNAEIAYLEEAMAASQDVKAAAGSVAPGFVTATKAKNAMGIKVGEYVGGGNTTGVRPVKASEIRDVMAATKAKNLEDLQTIKNEGQRNVLAQTYKNIIKESFDTLFPVAEMQRTNALQAERNRLTLEGVPTEVIDLQENLKVASEKAALAEIEFAKEFAKSEEVIKKYNSAIASGNKLLPEQAAELQRAQEYVKSYGNEIDAARQKFIQFTIAQTEAAIAALKQADALKKQQETIQRIDSSVQNATSSYKDFVKEVIKGGDPTEALKKFQEALTDQALTVFLDFAMKPVESFLNDSLRNIFKVPTAKETNKESIDKLQTQLDVLKANAKIAIESRDHLAKIEVNTQKEGITGTGTPASGKLGPYGADFSKLFPPGATETTGGNLNPSGVDPFAGIDPSQFYKYSQGVEQVDKTVTSSAENYQVVSDSMKKQAEEQKKTAEQAGLEGKKFQETLGKVTAGIGIAVSSMMTIMAGVQQIKKGGTGNTIAGIGSILMGLGSGIGGFASLLKGANGGIAAGGWKPFPAFANGGTVKGPTLGLVGEGKYNEAIIPLPDGKSVPVMLQGSSIRDRMGSGSSGNYGGSPVLSMSFESTTINGVEYVSRDQLERAMSETRRAASKEGAARGSTMAIDKIKNSPSTRRSIGIR